MFEIRIVQIPNLHKHTQIHSLKSAPGTNHTTKTIRFTKSTDNKVIGRVVEKVRAPKGFGFCTFIAHTILNYNPTKNCQYLKNDCLRFRIVKVELKWYLQSTSYTKWTFSLWSWMDCASAPLLLMVHVYDVLFHSDCFYIVHTCSILRWPEFTREYWWGVVNDGTINEHNTTATQYNWETHW